MSVIIATATLLIAAPTGIWIIGAEPSVILFAHVCAFIFTGGLFALTLSHRRVTHLFRIGFASGVLGSLLSEIFTHIANMPNLATAFTAYASAGPALYRLDQTKIWWPFIFVVLNGLCYGGLAELLTHLLRRKKFSAYLS